LGESDFQSIKTLAKIGFRVNRMKIRLVTSVGLIDAKVVTVDAANDLALLKADGRIVTLVLVY
jgi:maleate cis-trans isomerase